MTGDQIASIAYLGLLAAAIGGSLLMQNRQELGKMTQMAMIWVLIIVGVVAVYGLWNDIRRDMPFQTVATDGAIEAPIGRDGHFHLVVDVNGVPIRFVVDTGASDIVLSTADAVRVGIDPKSLTYLGTAQTANGIVRTARVTLDDVRLGDLVDRNVRAVVNEGDLDVSLLGMSYLTRFGRIEITDDRIVLRREN
jgi:aspartyl protease family protein